MEYIPNKRTMFRVDFQKKYQPGENFLIEKILTKDDIFGRPFLPQIKLRARIVGHKLRKKIVIFNYKAKKRYKVRRGHRTRYTEIEVMEVLESNTTPVQE